MTSPVPVSRTSFASTTADEAWNALSRMYTQAQPHTDSPDASIRFAGASTPEIAVDRGWLHTAAGNFEPNPEQLNFITVDRGRINLNLGRRGALCREAGDSYLYPGQAAHLQWEGFGAFTVRMDPLTVARAASELTGIPEAHLRFTSPQPVSVAQSRSWQQTVHLLWRQLAAGHGSMNALVHRELVNLTAAAAISAFPNTALLQGYVPGPGDVRPSAVRRAVAYIEAHASLPITFTDMAVAAGTTPRALRAAFRKHLDTTPAAYLRRARLEGARHDLRSGKFSHGDQVRQVGVRWGFPRHDRFVMAYRDAFGVSPGPSAQNPGDSPG